MTLGTGDPSEHPEGRLATCAFRRTGFTLLEILVVIAILLTLMTVLAVAVGPAVLERGPEKATRALLRRLVLHIEDYRGATGEYPPDGIDSSVRNADGESIQGSAALYYALTSPLEVRRMVAGVPRIVRLEPIVERLQDSELTDEDPTRPGVREILDRWGTPIHYDNTEDGRFRPQGGDVHYPPLDDNDHPVDPRTLPESEGGVPRPGEPQSQAFDLWSHGSNGHSPDAPPSPIGTWNLGDE